MYKILYVIFEGYFCWEKTSKKSIQESYGEATHHKQIVKRKGQQEYWFRSFKIKPILLALSCNFRLKKEVYSVVRVIRTWNPCWLVSYDFSKLFDHVDKSTIVVKLKKYIEDSRLTSQLAKLFIMKVANITTVASKGAVNVFRSNLLLLFNFYIRSFDKYVEKVVQSAFRINNIK